MKGTDIETTTFSGYDLYLATLQGSTYTTKVVPEKVRFFVRDVRGTLGLEDKESFVVDEQTSFDIPTRFAVHWYLQERIEHLQTRKLMLSPVMKVQRMHVRLDATHLGLVFNDLVASEALIGISHLEPPKWELKLPTEKSHPDPKERKEAKQTYKTAKADHDKKTEIYKKAKGELEDAPLTKIAACKTVDPEAKLIKEIPLPSTTRPKDLEKNDPRWTKELRPKIQRLRDEAIEKRSNVRNTPEYVEALKKYQEYEAKCHELALSLFVSFKDRNAKLGWKPSGSVMTDGVSLCVSYERTVFKINKTCEEASNEFAKSKAAKKDAAKEASEMEPCDDYDPGADTCFGDALVLGIDPGRVSIVTIVCTERRKFGRCREVTSTRRAGF